MKGYSIIWVLLFSYLCANSQQVLPTTISDKLVLTSQSLPYLVQGNTTISETGELCVEAGVTIQIGAGLMLTNNGRLVVKGADLNPVLFTSTSDTVKWKYINNNGTVVADYLSISNAVRFISSYGDTILLNNCYVSNTSGGIGDDLIGAHYADKIVIKDCYLEGNIAAGKTDGVDLDGISNDTIVGNTILNFSDDGIDLGTNSSSVYIANNNIKNCDMGVSVGETSTATILKNIITNNSAGIQSHSGSVLTCDRNTLYANKVGLRAYHNYGQTTSGGTIHIKNSIISNCTSNVTAVVDNSSIDITYCLSDSVLPVGEGNILGDALFYDVGESNFSLTSASPAIDKGKADSDGDGMDFVADADDQDPDGSRFDIGALPYFNGGLMVNEITSSNLSLITDEFNQYPDAIELYNNTDAVINLNGYYFTDNKSKLTKHKIVGDLFISSKGFLVLWADDLENDTINHLPFKLSGDGEFFAISDADGQLIDGVEFGSIPNNMSFGRNQETRQWVYFEEPTIYTANIGAGKNGIASQPIFSDNGGGVDLPLSLALSSKEAGGTIYYSTDGSAPSEGSVYSADVLIDEQTTIRAITIDTQKISSYPETRLYYEQMSSTLPVFSVSTDNENLYGDMGIYTNYSKSGVLWERPASIGYYNSDMKFSCTTGLRIQGGNSVYMPKKSFRLFFRGGYGTGVLNTSPFRNFEGIYENIVLRAGYDDDITNYDGTLLRDPFSAELWNQLGELATKSDFVSMYLNNDYWGIYNIRESVNEHFVELNMGISNFDLVRFQKWGNTLKYGSWDSWNELDAFFETADFTTDESYDALAEIIDMNSFLNLLSFVHCSQFRSWTWGAFGIKPENDKWNWTIWDTDRAFSILSWNGFTEYATTTAEKWPNIYPQKLMVNERFQNDLINRTCDLFNTTFKPQNSIALFDSLVAEIEPEMDKEYERWSAGSRSDWDNNVDDIRSFLGLRPNVVYEQMKSYFELSDTINVIVQIQGNGEVKLNSITISEKQWQGTYMADIPLAFEAIPNFGSKFLYWENHGTDHNLSLVESNDFVLLAVFDTVSLDAQMPLVINEIMYHPELGSGDEWIEIYNPNAYSVPLVNYKFSDGGEGNEFIFPEQTEVPAFGYFVLAADLEAFNQKYTDVNPVIGSFSKGGSGFSLSNSGESIMLYNSEDVLVDSVSYLDEYPWPIEADGDGFSLQLLSHELDNTLPSSWYAGIYPISTPGYSNPLSIAVDESDADNLNVYPNPFSSSFKIEISDNNSQLVELRIYDLSGRVILQMSDIISDKGSYVDVNTVGLENGVYVLGVVVKKNGNLKQYTKKLIKN